MWKAWRVTARPSACFWARGTPPCGHGGETHAAPLPPLDLPRTWQVKGGEARPASHPAIQPAAAAAGDGGQSLGASHPVLQRAQGPGAKRGARRTRPSTARQGPRTSPVPHGPGAQGAPRSGAHGRRPRVGFPGAAEHGGHRKHAKGTKNCSLRPRNCFERRLGLEVPAGPAGFYMGVERGSHRAVRHALQRAVAIPHTFHPAVGVAFRPPPRARAGAWLHAKKLQNRIGKFGIRRRGGLPARGRPVFRHGDGADCGRGRGGPRGACAAKRGLRRSKRFALLRTHDGEHGRPQSAPHPALRHTPEPAGGTGRTAGRDAPCAALCGARGVESGVIPTWRNHPAVRPTAHAGLIADHAAPETGSVTQG